MIEQETQAAADWKTFRTSSNRLFTAIAEKGLVIGETPAGRFVIHLGSALSAVSFFPEIVRAQEKINDDQRYRFRESTRALIRSATMLAELAIRALESGEIAPEVESLLRSIEKATLDLGEILDQGNSRKALARAVMGEEAPRPPEAESRSVELIRGLMRLMALTGTCRRIVEDSDASEVENSLGDAARMRRLRERKRRGVSYHTPIDIYAGDLDLLWRMGFLSAGDKDNREAVGRAMEAFILYSFLTVPDPNVTFSERLGRQKGRSDAVSRRRP